VISSCGTCHTISFSLDTLIKLQKTADRDLSVKDVLLIGGIFVLIQDIDSLYNFWYNLYKVSGEALCYRGLRVII